MPAVIRKREQRISDAPAVKLGPRGPFPDAPMRRVLERRWLHYAFLSADNELGLVANVAHLGPPPDQPHLGTRCTSILLLHKRDRGWRASDFNAETYTPLWSAFQQPHPIGTPGSFELASKAGPVSVRLQLERSSHPCTSQCAPFATNQHLRWQSETGVIAKGRWQYSNETFENVEAVGYHERVRGYWGWPELGGWVFGFANDPDRSTHAPPVAVVFTLIQPLSPLDAATASVMLWRHGRLVRHFPRRRVNVAVAGEVDKVHIRQVPALSNLLGVPPMETVPRRLLIQAAMGSDWVLLDFLCEDVARVVIPSETSIAPFSVHEVIGPVFVKGRIGGKGFAFETRGIVEFAGGAGGD